MLKFHATEAFAPVPSVTVIVVLYLPAVVLAPVRAPVVGFSVIPGGRAPVAVNAYGARHTAAFTPVVSGALTGCLGRPTGLGWLGAGEGLQLERCADEQRQLPRVAVRAAVRLHGEAEGTGLRGGAEMTPFEPSVRPVGSVPEAIDHELTDPPPAVSWTEYGWLIPISGIEFVVTTSRCTGLRPRSR